MRGIFDSGILASLGGGAAGVCAETRVTTAKMKIVPRTEFRMTSPIEDVFIYRLLFIGASAKWYRYCLVEYHSGIGSRKLGLTTTRLAEEFHSATKAWPFS